MASIDWYFDPQLGQLKEAYLELGAQAREVHQRGDLDQAGIELTERSIAAEAEYFDLFSKLRG